MLRHPSIRLLVLIVPEVPPASLMILLLELIYGCKMPSATYHVNSLLPLLRFLLGILGLRHCLGVQALAVDLLDGHDVSVAFI